MLSLSPVASDRRSGREGLPTPPSIRIVHPFAQPRAALRPGGKIGCELGEERCHSNRAYRPPRAEHPALGACCPAHRAESTQSALLEQQDWLQGLERMAGELADEVGQLEARLTSENERLSHEWTGAGKLPPRITSDMVDGLTPQIRAIEATRATARLGQARAGNPPRRRTASSAPKSNRRWSAAKSSACPRTSMRPATSSPSSAAGNRLSSASNRPAARPTSCRSRRKSWSTTKSCRWSCSVGCWPCWSSGSSRSARGTSCRPPRSAIRRLDRRHRHRRIGRRLAGQVLRRGLGRAVASTTATARSRWSGPDR